MADVFTDLRTETEALAELAERHADGGLEVAEVAGGHVLRTRADLADTCDRLRARPAEDRLSPAALETLAVSAYLEPVSRPQISRLRGVAVDHAVGTLLERGMVEEAGRAADGGAEHRAARRGSGGIADHAADHGAGACADDGTLLLLVERRTRARGHEDRERGNEAD